ncbi:uncharacterized protein BO72DRAFT_293081 [Aspergillus fijiensis CBS 313.89]|uniref:Uncharacterized protein n=1 Tax=Aspergillus fijiensis CBS 313.89 TaxID=1448319 RepID=A0A8G1RH61_9EURO|nr:uncharacterized protein BO72DRAFT_293081 [Aspergillus fijiensis CBS 313.89]RAK72068.1 hypothetical protein BO72DRAFT_293081 [Aspergillus fijiensis CBS 313.89]
MELLLNITFFPPTKPSADPLLSFLEAHVYFLLSLCSFLCLVVMSVDARIVRQKLVLPLKNNRQITINYTSEATAASAVNGQTGVCSSRRVLCEMVFAPPLSVSLPTAHEEVFVPSGSGTKTDY